MSLGREHGLFDALRRVAATLVAMLQSRLELASLELGEAWERLFAAALLGLFAVLLLLASAVTASVWLVMLLWPVYGPVVLLAFAVGYLLVGLGLLAWLRQRLRTQKPLLAATLGELERDAAFLRAAPPGPRH